MSLRLVAQGNDVRPRVNKYVSLKAVAALSLTVAFTAGFGVALLLRPKAKVQFSNVPPADFRIALPEGETVITITDPRSEPEQLARFVIKRDGSTITGIPQIQKQIAARARLSAQDAAFFRRELGGVVSPSDTLWQRALRIRDWLASGQHRMALPGLATRIPREAYEQMKQGEPVLCGNLAEIYVALCESAGLNARAVGMSLMVRNGFLGNDTHAAAEVWIPEMGGWVYQDPTFNCYWEVDGKPASALQLHDALINGQELKPAPENPRVVSAIKDYYVNPRLFFRHISYEYKAGGALLYYADARLEPLNLRDRNWIQTDSKAAIERLDTDGNTIVERQGEIAPGIFMQLIGNDLFIRDRREQDRGIHVRSSSGAVQVCAYEHRRAEELGIFSGRNFVHNGSFNLTGQSDAIAAEWSVDGPVDALAPLGGQGVSAQAGGKLWQRVQVRPNGRYLMYAKVNAVRGNLTWSVSDVSRGMDSRGMLEPGRIREIVSDVVVSQSGYLDVAFEVPQGGSFRVMDVIVTELPDNAGTNKQQTQSASRISTAE
jgi:hypothetical protein